MVIRELTESNLQLPTHREQRPIPHFDKSAFSFKSSVKYRGGGGGGTFQREAGALSGQLEDYG